MRWYILKLGKVKHNEMHLLHHFSSCLVWVGSILPATKRATQHQYTFLYKRSRKIYILWGRSGGPAYMKNCLTCLARPFWMVVIVMDLQHRLGLVIVVFTILLREYCFLRCRRCRLQWQSGQSNSSACAIYLHNTNTQRSSIGTHLSWEIKFWFINALPGHLMHYYYL